MSKEKEDGKRAHLKHVWNGTTDDHKQSGQPEKHSVDHGVQREQFDLYDVMLRESV